ncbi:hypothetical protein Pmar_PMAR020326 [Perkinsus marinus ATCC 50983]|uniref:Uncharacterized protein n=1 Tax=Perkinsus marinus (strain ATCC 50983 / TXsc) TaxID=423536 RepID=C5KFD8_PERM5|nr:hypothetical protein Pmar_PMAR020326 [Perkinsus marinus ATCC 50983]EER16798.1 hypothetical protein Pmar_PMAR020326 [Perkinsus marinus ATCC 50983]|eukprot:XP_002785002.1 hypothetical protein Pmar_PMAR020326 [Perkinsus marinus ATCC 50983]
MKLALTKLYFGLAGAALKRKPNSPLYAKTSLGDLEEPTAAHWLITELCADSTLYNLGQNVAAALPEPESESLPESEESDDGEESE